jgi:hypothetical protein
MPENKYELRNNDLHELMRKAPHLFIVWGYFFVFIFLIASLSLLNRFEITEIKNIPIRVINISRSPSVVDSIRLTLGVHDTNLLSPAQVIDLQFSKNSVEKKLKGEIIKIVSRDNFESLLYVVVKKTSSEIKFNMIGNAQVTIQKTTLISDLIDNALKK